MRDNDEEFAPLLIALVSELRQKSVEDKDYTDTLSTGNGRCGNRRLDKFLPHPSRETNNRIKNSQEKPSLSLSASHVISIPISKSEHQFPLSFIPKTLAYNHLSLRP